MGKSNDALSSAIEDSGLDPSNFGDTSNGDVGDFLSGSIDEYGAGSDGNVNFDDPLDMGDGSEDGSEDDPNDSAAKDKFEYKNGKAILKKKSSGGSMKTKLILSGLLVTLLAAGGIGGYMMMSETNNQVQPGPSPVEASPMPIDAAPVPVGSEPIVADPIGDVSGEPVYNDPSSPDPTGSELTQDVVNTQTAEPTPVVAVAPNEKVVQSSALPLDGLDKKVSDLDQKVTDLTTKVDGLALAINNGRESHYTTKKTSKPLKKYATKKKAKAKVKKQPEKLALTQEETLVEAGEKSSGASVNEVTPKAQPALDQWKLKAVVPGRAFLENQDGDRLDVTTGDALPGCGLVSVINAESGEVVAAKCKFN